MFISTFPMLIPVRLPTPWMLFTLSGLPLSPIKCDILLPTCHLCLQEQLSNPCCLIPTHLIVCRHPHDRMRRQHEIYFGYHHLPPKLDVDIVELPHLSVYPFPQTREEYLHSPSFKAVGLFFKSKLQKWSLWFSQIAKIVTEVR